jgi:hypothetical protein
MLGISLTNCPFKLERMFLAGLSRLVFSKDGVKHLSSAPHYGRLLALPKSISQGWKGLHGNKHSSLLGPFVSYERNEELRVRTMFVISVSRLGEISPFRLLLLNQFPPNVAVSTNGLFLKVSK